LTEQGRSAMDKQGRLTAGSRSERFKQRVAKDLPFALEKAGFPERGRCVK
jgi:hypothetical protein